METPTLQSIKWWPGSLGRVATHAIVYAQLVVDGAQHVVDTCGAASQTGVAGDGLAELLAELYPRLRERNEAEHVALTHGASPARPPTTPREGAHRERRSQRRAARLRWRAP